MLTRIHENGTPCRRELSEDCDGGCTPPPPEEETCRCGGRVEHFVGPYCARSTGDRDGYVNPAGEWVTLHRHSDWCEGYAEVCTPSRCGEECCRDESEHRERGELEHAEYVPARLLEERERKLVDAIDGLVAQERERCARVVASCANQGLTYTQVAAKIREGK